MKKKRVKKTFFALLFNLAVAPSLLLLSLKTRKKTQKNSETHPQGQRPVPRACHEVPLRDPVEAEDPVEVAVDGARRDQGRRQRVRARRRRRGGRRSRGAAADGRVVVPAAALAARRARVLLVFVAVVERPRVPPV